MGGPPRRTSCLVAESPGFTGLGAPSLSGFPVLPLPGQCINSQPWLRAVTHRVAPLMRGRPGRRRRRARATGLLPVGPPWARAEDASPRGWAVAQCATTALAGAVPRPCVRGARGRLWGLGPVPGVVSLPFPPSCPACPALRVAGRPVRVSLTLAEAGSDPRGHLGVTRGVYLCAGKPPLADIILSHPPDLTRCDSVIGLAIPAMSGHIQYRGAASGVLYIRISGINRVFFIIMFP